MSIPKNTVNLFLIIISIAFLMFCPFLLTSSSIAFQTLITGIILSSIYLTISIGFSLIYGVAKQFKLSIGGYYVIGAYTMFFFQNAIEIPLKFSPNNLLQSIYLLFIFFVPMIVILIIITIIFYQFDGWSSGLKFLLIVSPLISLFSIFAISGSIAYGFFSGLSISCLGIAGWYLEFNKKSMTFIVFIMSIMNPLLYLLFSFPLIYLNLVVVATSFTAFLAMLSDRFLLEKVRYSNVNVLIVTFSLAIIIQSVVQLMFFPQNGTTLSQFGVTSYSLNTIVLKSKIISFFGATIPMVKVFSLIVFSLILILLFIFLRFSKTGLAIKAISQNEIAASLVGINIRKITAIVSGIGMGLVALASILTSSFSAPILNPSMGWTILIFAIVVVTLGGMGSLFGTVVASIILGTSTVLVSILNLNIIINLPYFGELFSLAINSSYATLVPLVLVIIIMIIKPHGLFGNEQESTS